MKRGVFLVVLVVFLLVGSLSVVGGTDGFGWKVYDMMYARYDGDGCDENQIAKAKPVDGFAHGEGIEKCFFKKESAITPSKHGCVVGVSDDYANGNDYCAGGYKTEGASFVTSPTKIKNFAGSKFWEGSDFGDSDAKTCSETLIHHPDPYLCQNSKWTLCDFGQRNEYVTLKSLKDGALQYYFCVQDINGEMSWQKKEQLSNFDSDGDGVADPFDCRPNNKEIYGKFPTGCDPSATTGPKVCLSTSSAKEVCNNNGQDDDCDATTNDDCDKDKEICQASPNKFSWIDGISDNNKCCGNNGLDDLGTISLDGTTQENICVGKDHVGVANDKGVKETMGTAWTSSCAGDWCWLKTSGTPAFKIMTIRTPEEDYDVVSNTNKWIECRKNNPDQKVLPTSFLNEQKNIMNANRFYCYEEGNRWSWADCRTEDIPDSGTNNGVKNRFEGDGLFSLHIDEGYSTDSQKIILVENNQGLKNYYGEGRLSFGDYNVLELHLRFTSIDLFKKPEVTFEISAKDKPYLKGNALSYAVGNSQIEEGRWMKIRIPVSAYPKVEAISFSTLPKHVIEVRNVRLTKEDNSDKAVCSGQESVSKKESSWLEKGLDTINGEISGENICNVLYDPNYKPADSDKKVDSVGNAWLGGDNFNNLGKNLCCGNTDEEYYAGMSKNEYGCWNSVPVENNQPVTNVGYEVSYMKKERDDINVGTAEITSTVYFTTKEYVGSKYLFFCYPSVNFLNLDGDSDSFDCSIISSKMTISKNTQNTNNEVFKISEKEINENSLMGHFGGFVKKINIYAEAEDETHPAQIHIKYDIYSNVEALKDNDKVHIINYAFPLSDLSQTHLYEIDLEKKILNDNPEDKKIKVKEFKITSQLNPQEHSTFGNPLEIKGVLFFESPPPSNQGQSSGIYKTQVNFKNKENIIHKFGKNELSNLKDVKTTNPTVSLTDAPSNAQINVIKTYFWNPLGKDIKKRDLGKEFNPLNIGNYDEIHLIADINPNEELNLITTTPKKPLEVNNKKIIKPCMSETCTYPLPGEPPYTITYEDTEMYDLFFVDEEGEHKLGRKITIDPNVPNMAGNAPGIPALPPTDDDAGTGKGKTGGSYQPGVQKIESGPFNNHGVIVAKKVPLSTVRIYEDKEKAFYGCQAPDYITNNALVKPHFKQANFCDFQGDKYCSYSDNGLGSEWSTEPLTKVGYDLNKGDASFKKDEKGSLIFPVFDLLDLKDKPFLPKDRVHTTSVLPARNFLSTIQPAKELKNWELLGAQPGAVIYSDADGTINLLDKNHLKSNKIPVPQKVELHFSHEGTCKSKIVLYNKDGKGVIKTTDKFNTGDFSLLTIEFFKGPCTIKNPFLQLVEKDEEPVKYEEFQELETDRAGIACCPKDYCWNGYACTAPMGEHTFLAEKTSNGKTYRCLAGEWTISTPKKDWNEKEFGFCEKIEQCYVMGSNDPNKGDFQACLDNNGYVADHFCAAGNWTSRTKFLASALLDAVDKEDYTIYCTDPISAFNIVKDENKPFILGTEKTVSTGGKAPLPGQTPTPPKKIHTCSKQRHPKISEEEDTCINNVCVVRYGEKDEFSTAFATTMNKPGNSTGSFLTLLKINPTDLNDLCQGEDKGFVKCKLKGTEFWYDQRVDAIIYSEDGISIKKDTLEKMWDTVKNFFANFFGQGNKPSKTSKEFLLKAQNFNEIYLAKQGKQEVRAVKEVLNELEGGITVEYEGFKTPLCQYYDKTRIKHPSFKSKGVFNTKDFDFRCVDTNKLTTIQAKTNLDYIFPNITANLRVALED